MDISSTQGKRGLKIIGKVFQFRFKTNLSLKFLYSMIGFKAALHIQRFERAGAATKIDFFGSDRKRP